jgi:hypothetical protein
MTETTVTASKTDACFITGFSHKDTPSIGTIIAPSIENIIEEDESEIENENPSTEITKVEEESIKKSIAKIENDVVEASTKKSTNPYSKFKLEPVNLSDLDTNKSNLIVNKPSSTPLSSLQSSTPKFKTNTDNKKIDLVGGDDVNEMVEIRVEEGYATRQMDEYFRQTIAAIKEELTKKLETKTDKKPNAKADEKYDENYYFYDSDSMSDLDQNYDQAHNNNNDFDYEKYSSKTNECGCISCCCDPYTDRDEHVIYATHRSMTSPDGNHLFQSYLAATSKKPKRRDRLNGCLVLVGCILNNFIIDGLCFNYANLFDLVQKEFHLTSKLLASLPYTFLIGFLLLIAPVSLFLTKQYGTKRVAILGTFISTCSMLISSFLKDNLVLFLIFNGILTGAGIGLIYVPTVMATSKWFLRRRMFATSLNILGACIGAAIYPLMSELLLRRYEMFDALLILSGVQLNCLIGSLLLKDNKSAFLISKLHVYKRKDNQVSYATVEENNNVRTNKSKPINSAHLLDKGKNKIIDSF